MFVVVIRSNLIVNTDHSSESSIVSGFTLNSFYICFVGGEGCYSYLGMGYSGLSYLGLCYLGLGDLKNVCFISEVIFHTRHCNESIPSTLS